VSASGLVEAGPWFSWHFDRFSLPDEVPVVARTPLASQAFSVGRVLGLQFHPEVTTEVLESWLSTGGSEQLAGLGIAVEPLLERTRREAGAAAARADALVRRFVGDVARRPVVPVPVPPVAGDATVLTPAR
jgi:GMP synthase-like glutamine amidotransferase